MFAASVWDLGLAVLKSGGMTALFFFATLAGAGYAIRVIWKENQALRAQIDRLQETRVEEAKVTLTALHDSTRSSDLLSRVLQERR